MGKIKRYTRHGFVTLKNEGLTQLAIKSLQKLEKSKKQKSTHVKDKINYVSLVARSDALKADWVNSPYKAVKRNHVAPYTINWVMSPPSGGGGHQNIFRFIEYLDRQGYKNNVYLYSTFDNMTISQAKENVRNYCKAKRLSFYRYYGKMTNSDVVFATGWETAYPVFNDATTARKMYFVQDFEPFFYPIGTDYILAENTYKFGFYGITAGGFLQNKLSNDYGMKCDSYDFGAEKSIYKNKNTMPRKEIFFYARPVTERRGFDLGIMALEIFHKSNPEYTINLAGWDVSEYNVPFPYVNHKALRIEELPELYNKCAAALVISLTNMSLLPLELLACGTIPIVNDGANNRLVSNNPNIVYQQPSPAALAKSLIETVESPEILLKSKKAALSVEKSSWETSCEKFKNLLIKELSDG